MLELVDKCQGKGDSVGRGRCGHRRESVSGGGRDVLLVGPEPDGDQRGHAITQRGGVTGVVPGEKRPRLVECPLPAGDVCRVEPIGQDTPAVVPVWIEIVERDAAATEAEPPQALPAWGVILRVAVDRDHGSAGHDYGPHRSGYG